MVVRCIPLPLAYSLNPGRVPIAKERSPPPMLGGMGRGLVSQPHRGESGSHSVWESRRERGKPKRRRPTHNSDRTVPRSVRNRSDHQYTPFGILPHACGSPAPGRTAVLAHFPNRNISTSARDHGSRDDAAGCVHLVGAGPPGPAAVGTNHLSSLHSHTHTYTWETGQKHTAGSTALNWHAHLGHCMRMRYAEYT